MRSLPIPLVRRWLRWVAALAVTGVIVYFSVFGSVPGPPEPGPIWDKRLHFAAYAGLGYALAYATVEWRQRSLRRGMAVVAFAVLVGLVIELIQGSLPTRYYSTLDLLANVVGAHLVVPWLLLERRIRYVRIG